MAPGAALGRRSDREEDITCVKFSPHASILAVASAERCIDLYTKVYEHNVNSSARDFVLQRVGVCRGHAAAVTHMDFSEDAIYLRSNDASGEVMRWRWWMLGPAVTDSTLPPQPI